MTESETISKLKERIAKLEEELAKAQTPTLFMKFMWLLLLTGTIYVLYKCRTLIKYAVIILFIYILFGGVIGSAWNSTCEFISTSWTSWREEVHKQNQIENAREEADAAARRNTEVLAAETKARTDIIEAETRAKTEVVKAEEETRRAAWEREQIEKRNNAINQAIINGTWNSQSAAPEPTQTPEPAPDSEGNKPEPEVQVYENNGTITRVKITYNKQ